MEPTSPAPPEPSRLLRQLLGALLAGAGLYLLVAAFGLVRMENMAGSRGLFASIGVLLTASGIQVAQWAGAAGRLYDAMGAIVVTSMAAMSGWVARYGDARGFRTSVSAGGVQATSHGSVTVARFAFGFGAAVMGLIALWAWARVVRRKTGP